MKSRTLCAALLLAIFPSADVPYRLAVPGYRYEFPRDFFAHPEFQTEWWYTTGNVKSTDGRAFGFELTFFRQAVRSEEHTSELQSPCNLVCRLLLEKKKKYRICTRCGACANVVNVH